MKTLFLLTICILPAVLLAQSPETLRKIETARIALITERLKLTPGQAEKFWPIYREYTEQRQQLRREYLDARRDVHDPNMTEERSKELLEKGLQFKERQLELEKRYTERLNEVITTQQILHLRRAEEDFRHMLLERLERRREQRDRMQRREDLRNNN